MSGPEGACGLPGPPSPTAGRRFRGRGPVRGGPAAWARLPGDGRAGGARALLGAPPGVSPALPRVPGGATPEGGDDAVSGLCEKLPRCWGGGCRWGGCVGKGFQPLGCGGGFGTAPPGWGCSGRYGRGAPAAAVARRFGPFSPYFGRFSSSNSAKTPGNSPPSIREGENKPVLASGCGACAVSAVRAGSEAATTEILAGLF